VIPPSTTGSVAVIVRDNAAAAKQLDWKDGVVFGASVSAAITGVTVAAIALSNDAHSLESVAALVIAVLGILQSAATLSINIKLLHVQPSV
jgi:hypothetical protein